MISERDCVSLILDPRVRSKAKGHIETWMFESEIYRELCSAILKPEFDSIVPDRRLTITIIQSSNSKLPGESVYNEVDYLVSNHKDFSDNQVQSAVDLVQEFIQARLLARSVDLAANSSMKEAIPYLNKAASLSLVHTDDILDFSSADQVYKLYENDFPPNFKPIKSSFTLINHCSSCKGYKYGDLVLLSLPPGVGKSTMLVCEGVSALRQNLKVFHMVIGDMSGFDLFSKYVARIKNEELEEVIRNPVKYANDTEVKELLKNLRVDVAPSFKYTAEEVVSKARALKKEHNFDVMILDYDSNVAPTKTESMYLEGGYSYGLYKGIGVTERCVFILASQPKIEFWNTEVIPMTGANESSRKQHHIDFMITGNKNPASTRVGTLLMAKARRGITGKMARVRFDNHTSSVTEIFQAEYDSILAGEKKKTKEDLII